MNRPNGTGIAVMGHSRYLAKLWLTKGGICYNGPDGGIFHEFIFMDFYALLYYGDGI